MKMLINCLLVGLGGFAGSVLRYLAGLIPLGESDGFPIKTLAVNVAGAFLIGVIAAAATKNSGLDPRTVLLLKTGFCGGFTTFSTFALESVGLFQSGKTWSAVAYVLLSVVLSVLAVLAAELILMNK